MKVRVLVCMLVLAVGGCAQEAGLDAVRQKELAHTLKPLLKPGIETEDYQEAPGWYEPTNRQALKDFIVKYPDTEETYQAEAWLVFAQANTETSRNWSERKKIRAERAQKLETITSQTTRPGTVKMAKLLRVYELFEAEDYAGSKKQIYEILAHIEEYKSENDEQFRRCLKAIEESPSDIEPELRDMLVIEACYQNHFKRALTLAEDLKERFPAWDPQSVNGAISMLKRGWTPYPYFR